MMQMGKNVLRYTTVEARLWVWLVFAVTIASCWTSGHFDGFIDKKFISVEVGKEGREVVHFVDSVVFMVAHGDFLHPTKGEPIGP
jgi:hypothetical protein